MAIQYQSVAGMAPLLSRDLGIDLTDIGVLIGLYMAPGVALALPEGALGRRFGDKTTVLFGLALMTVGGLVMAFSESWGAQIGGRFVAGVGGVLLSVLLTNMVAAWFGPEEIGTATALLMVSWPVGLALSLMTVPAIAATYNVGRANVVVAALTAFGFLLLAASYQPHSSISKSGGHAPLHYNSAFLVIIAAVAYSLYIVGYGMILAFGPSMLTERGWSIADAGSTTSIVIWLGVLSTLIGGTLADKTKRYSLISVTSYLVFAVLLVAAPRSTSLILAFVALGIVSGLPIASVMSLPVRLLPAGARPIGLGLFYTVFYVAMMVGPGLGGRYASWCGTAGAAFDFGAVVVLVGAVLLCTVAYLPRVGVPNAQAAP
jgi:predicted MFS family arabinose efflux permease